LPKKSGLEVLAWVRRQPELKRLPVVMLTSSSQPEDINHAYDLAANSYLVKPANFEQLIELARVIDTYWLGANVRAGIVLPGSALSARPASSSRPARPNRLSP